MKKRSNISALLACLILTSAWLTSCVKSQMLADAEQQEIAMNAMTSPMSKASVGYDGEAFGVISYISPIAPDANWTDLSSATEYFHCSFVDKGDNIWGGETPQFWPPGSSSSLVFAGYAPYTKADGATTVSAEYDISTKTLTFENYQVEAFNETQTDLLYFLPKTDASGNYLVGINNNKEPVDVLFRHALTQLVCTVSIESGDETLVEPGSIVLKEVVSKGTGVISSGNSVNWTRSKADEDKENKTVSSGNPVLMIPGSSYQIEVSYNLQLPGDKELTESTILDIDPTIYYAGYKYIYNITIGASAITVDTEYKEWTDE